MYQKYGYEYQLFSHLNFLGAAILKWNNLNQGHQRTFSQSETDP